MCLCVIRGCAVDVYENNMFLIKVQNSSQLLFVPACVLVWWKYDSLPVLGMNLMFI